MQTKPNPGIHTYKLTSGEGTFKIKAIVEEEAGQKIILETLRVKVVDGKTYLR